MEALKALEAGTAALNKLHEEMSVEDVERLLEESNEAIAVCLKLCDSIKYHMHVGIDYRAMHNYLSKL